MRTLGALLLVSLVGCASTAEEQTNDLESASTHLQWGTCGTANPGVWKNDFIPQQTGHFSVTFGFTATQPSIDAVLGLGNVKAAHFTDLGPIVRLNEQGYIDARDGGSYRADAPFSYAPKGWLSHQWVKMDVDIPTHRYTVTAWHDGQGDTTTIASNYAFRTEQQSLTRLANVGQFVDSSSGQSQACDAQTAPPVCLRTFYPKRWYVTTFQPHSGQLTFDVNVETIGYNIDAVVGLSPSASPARFADLAAIVRFNPAGYIDVRDGDTYRADRQVPYSNGNTYDLRFVVDTNLHRYSVLKSEWDGWQPIATNYAFRTEQANASTLQTLGEYVDNTDPDYEVIGCDLTEMY